MALEAVQAQAGHVSIESTRLYLHLTNDWLADEYHHAAELIDAGQPPSCFAPSKRWPHEPPSAAVTSWPVPRRRVQPAPGPPWRRRRPSSWPPCAAIWSNSRTFLAPRSVEAADNTLRQLTRWLVAETDVRDVPALERTHIEDYKVWLAPSPAQAGANLAKTTQRQRLSMIRIFFERLIEWDWPDAPGRNPVLLWRRPGAHRATARSS